MSSYQELISSNLKESVAFSDDYYYLLKLSKIVDSDNTPQNHLELIRFAIRVFYWNFREKERYKLTTEQINNIAEFVKLKFAYFFAIENEMTPKEYVLLKHICWLFEAQIDFVNGRFTDARVNFFKFLEYVNIEDDFFQDNFRYYHYQYEVLYNIVKISVLIEDYDTAEDILEKNKILEERISWADEKERKNAEEILKPNNMYMFSLQNTSDYFLDLRRYNCHSLLSSSLSVELFGLEKKDDYTIDVMIRGKAPLKIHRVN